MPVFVSIILLAFIQGLTEFLPVSSSGHLALFGKLFGLPADLGLSTGIILHAGSLFAIIIFYHKTLLGFLHREQLRLLWMVIVGSIPAAIAGILLKQSGIAEKLFGDMLSISLGFLITASLLRLTGKAKLTAGAQKDLNQISLPQTLTIGFAQMFAIIPGISRSGSTIAAGILSGVKFEAAAEFSFLLALPAIAGASCLEIIPALQNGISDSQIPALYMLAGFIVSMLTSFAALTLLIKIIRKGKLAWFSWYLFLLGAGTMVWQIISMNGKN